MKYINRYATYIAGLAVLLLIILAGMQYQWLSEISRTQKNRLENQMQSGAKSFSTEFNSLFSKAGSAVNLLGNEPTLIEKWQSDYQAWLSVTEYPELLKDIYLIPPAEYNETGGLVFDTEGKTFQKLTVQQLKKLRSDWQFERKTERINKGEMLFLGEESLIIKRAPHTHNYFDEFLTLLTNKKNLRRYFSSEMESSYIIMRLDNEVIRQEILPDYFENYFGSDYSNQLNLVIKDNLTDRIYYQTHDTDITQNNPEVVQRIGQLELQSFIILFGDKSADKNFNFEHLDGNKQVLDSTLQKVSKTTVNSLKFSFRTNKNSETTSPDSIKIWNSNSSDSLRVGFTNASRPPDTPNSNTKKLAPRDGLSLEVFMKEGDLEAYISGTLWKNMGISLSILFILGLAIGLVSHNARTSQNLADQQMMFVAGISHELKTPISVINSAAENMQDGIIRNPTKMKEYGALIYKEGNRLKRMVDEVMQLAKLQSDQIDLHKEPVQLDNFIHTIQLQLQALLNETDMKVEYYEQPENITLLADRDMLSQITGNLINNAIKYRDGNSRIIIRAKKYPEHTEFSIQDFGTGIPEHEQKQIFNPFYRGEIVRKHQIQGNGLGLYIIKQLVERHGGQIEVESTPGVKTLFTIYLPNE